MTAPQEQTTQPASSPASVDADWLERLCREAGADDVGLVELGRPALDDQRDAILELLPGTRTLISFVVRTNREPIRSPQRSLANLEFHHTGDAVDAVARSVVRALEDAGVRAANPAMGFPMEQSRFPGRIWTVSHKPVAEAAGLGRMGIHRSVIHPRFGSFVLLGTILVAADLAQAQAVGSALEGSPCVSCKLCVAACPVGAIAPDGHFDFSACYTHNYREFMGGFTDWVGEVIDAPDRRTYRERVGAADSASMWQSLSFGANYKAAYCIAVCPAGDDVLAPFLADRPEFLERVVQPLRAKPETLYVLEGSDAEQHAARRFPHKRTQRVGNSLAPVNLDGFLNGLPLVFQRGAAGNLAARFHFRFSGAERREATVVIQGGQIAVEEGLEGTPDLTVTADTATWLGYLSKERSLVWALLTRRLRLSGPPRLLRAFGRCFPR